MSTRADFALAGEAPQHFGVEASLTYIWDVPTLSWVKSTGGGGGGGGAVTVADGADVAEGTTSDAAWVSGSGTVISLLKKIASAGGSAVSIADGADVVEGALADAAIVTDTTGTVNGKLRGLVKHAYERMPAALGQTTMAASLPVALASNQSALGVTGTFFQATQPVSAAALPLPAGAATSALQTQPGVDIGDVTINNAAGASAVNVQDGGNSITVDGVFFQATQPVSAAALPLPAGAATSALQTQPGVDIGDVTINNAAGASAVNVQDGGNSLTVDAPVGTPVFTRLSDGAAALIGQQTMAASLPVVIASNQSAVPVSGTVTANAGTGTLSTKEVRAATPTQTSVASSATNVTILASNANRLGGTVFNESTQNLFLKLGATASATSYTARLVPSAYFEIPFAYTGIIDGLWASANGSARVTELAA